MLVVRAIWHNATPVVATVQCVEIRLTTLLEGRRYQAHCDADGGSRTVRRLLKFPGGVVSLAADAGDEELE